MFCFDRKADNYLQQQSTSLTGLKWKPHSLTPTSTCIQLDPAHACLIYVDHIYLRLSLQEGHKTRCDRVGRLRISPGTFFGEHSMLWGFCRRMTVDALDDCVLGQLERETCARTVFESGLRKPKNNHGPVCLAVVRPDLPRFPAFHTNGQWPHLTMPGT